MPQEEMTVDEYRALTFEITLLEIPPSLNNAYATVTNRGVSRRVMTSSARSWKDTATLLIRNAGRLSGFDIAPKQPFVIEAIYTAPNVLVWDVDGKAKLLIDAFCDAFGVDDRYLMELRQCKQRGACSVHMKVTVK